MLRRKGIFLTTIVAGALLVPGAVALAQVRPSTTPHPAASGTPAPAFHHPGVLVDPAELDLVRGKVTTGTQPWSSAFGRLHSAASLTHVPHPRADVDCGSGSVPNDSIAKVGDTPIPKSTFNALMTVAFAKYKAQGQKAPTVGTPAYTQLRDQAVSFLVQEEELHEEADKLGMKLSQKDVEDSLALIKKT